MLHLLENHLEVTVDVASLHFARRTSSQSFSYTCQLDHSVQPRLYKLMGVDNKVL